MHTFSGAHGRARALGGLVLRMQMTIKLERKCSCCVWMASVEARSSSHQPSSCSVLRHHHNVTIYDPFPTGLKGSHLHNLVLGCFLSQETISKAKVFKKRRDNLCRQPARSEPVQRAVPFDSHWGSPRHILASWEDAPEESFIIWILKISVGSCEGIHYKKKTWLNIKQKPWISHWNHRWNYLRISREVPLNVLIISK